MTSEELAAEFDKRSQNCAVLRDGSSHASPKARLDGKREAYAHCAILIRQHLCTPLDAANAEIARLKNPDLVTVRREDLRHTLSLTYPYIDEDTSVEIDARLTAMEDAAR